MTGFLRNVIWSLVQARLWLALLALSALLLSQRAAFPQIIIYPDAWTLPIAEWISFVMDGFVIAFKGAARSLSGVLNLVFSGVQTFLTGLPWSVSVTLFTAIAWQAGGWRLAAFTGALLIYVLASGYWVPAMNTLALVLVALPLSVLIGFGVGYLGYRSAAAHRVILPTLDLMQTIPAFAYLIPILLLFGFGPVVGLIASVVFAVPPMVRNTILGFRQIPPAVQESAKMSGLSPRQRFLWAEFPTALPQMLIGVNQTTMATLSMIIIAAIIGGFEDIGWEVLSAMRKAQFGQSLLAGAVIVVLAILLDRVTAAFAARQLPNASHVGLPFGGFVLVLLGLTGAAALGAQVISVLADWPALLVFSVAQPINRAMDDVLIAYGDIMASIRNTVQFFLLLPAKLGFERAIVPFTWGVTFTPAMKIGYWGLALGGSVLLFGFGLWRRGVAVAALAGLLYLGTTGVPWMSVILVTTLVAAQVGGRQLAWFVFAGIAYLLLSGLWAQSMLSVYLCAVAVIVCIALGGMIGIWAAGSGTVSNVIRPINDMLQTLPQFVLLIPALMLFQVGDFTALLAIVAYAIVPMVRYTEFGLRSVPVTLIEAGRFCGCSAWQLFWQVRLPQAMPQILIGINQTILYALGMLVIAALVGTTGLGQAIYVALGEADAGAGLAAGLGMALIAMMTDRILRAVIQLQRTQIEPVE